jgi:serine protease Do
MTLLQNNAAINSGNSGGGLFNLRGELIGIVNAKYAAEGVEGLAFAIPVDSAFVVEQDLIQYGYVRGVVDDGLVTLDVTADNLKYYYYNYKIDKVGVYVVSSKYCEGLANKDLILSVNGVAVGTTAELNAEISKYKVGDVITVVASREGEAFTVSLTLKEYVPDSIKNNSN